MEFGWSALWFIVAVSLLVTIHEYGHFWVARKLGFKVLRFSVGFGKPLYKKIGGAPDFTEYVIAAVPLGGYVRMLDERDGTVSPEDLPRAFASKEPWKRILVMLAGPAANIFFAIIVLWGMVWYTGVTYHQPLVGDVTVNTPAASADLRSGDQFLSIDGEITRDHGDVMLGLLDAVSADGTAAIDVRGSDGQVRHLQLSVPDADLRHRLTEPQALIHGLGFDFWRPLSPAKIGRVTEGKPAALAGLKPGDIVRAANGTTLRSYKDLYTVVRAHPGESVQFEVRRGASDLTIRVTPEKIVDNGQAVGRIYIEEDLNNLPPYPAALTTEVHLGPLDSLAMSVSRSWELTVTQAKFFVRMVTGHVSIKNLSGAISIAEYAGESAHAGAGSFMMLLVALSLSLGFLNLLPIPILDGGQIVFQIAEWVRGRPLSDRIHMVGQQAGLLLLVLLMSVALFNDISGIAARP